jgi:hypothetical protein
VFLKNIQEKNNVFTILNCFGEVRKLTLPSLENSSQVFKFCTDLFCLVRLRDRKTPSMLKYIRKPMMLKPKVLKSKDIGFRHIGGC